ncbi:proteoglycan 4 isoform X2 [Drosophila montana]|uniref:proteoglycan 4 isoform X2 n=1 Tax=Drosophila montana TaxID=40370 RepID=UPI00313F2782
MAEVGDIELDAQQKPKVAASETNSIEAEEAEKAVASEPKHEEKKISRSDALAHEPKAEKLDELSSLEQEIAKMHNIQHGTESGQEEEETTTLLNAAAGSTAENGNGSSNDALIMDELTATKRCTPVNKAHAKEEPETAAALEEADLIALLKGTDQEQEQSVQPAASEQKSNIELTLAKLDNVGVTIEGEGQYEIMEIDDGDNVSGPSPELTATVRSSPTAAKTGAKFAGKSKLSPEQARAVALEQMANLTAQKSRRKEPAAATVKQQQQQQQQPLDIISSLNDDWNEYDSGSDTATNSKAIPATKKPLIKKPKPTIEAPLMVGSVKVMLKSVSQKPVEKPKPAAEQPNSNSETTGFKRTRIIKRKIIWDPDVPETQKSFAQYASAKPNATASAKPNAIATTKAITAVAATTTTTITTTAIKTINAETAPKRPRPSTPKEPQKAAAAVKRSATPAKLTESNATTSPPKRRSQTPNVPNGAGSLTKKKKVSEIDRLMGDEGAANMMQAVEREQRELSGGELANKPLMRKRALTITGRKAAVANAVEVAAVPTKKESPPKAGKRATTTNSATAVDAVFTKGTKPRASDSWDYVYKQRASEESMIMRRRSNSSYSSNASVHRLSLDNKPGTVANLSDDASEASAMDPSFIFLKPENKANQRSDGSAPQTLANDFKRGGLPLKELKVAKVELVTLHKLEKVAQLVINTQLSKTGYTYKVQLLQKLNEMLNKLAKSNDCNTVLLSVQGQQFCQGIDCQDLLAATPEKRKSSATQLALVLKTYLRTLATFPKPLVAGIVGNLKNLGVMQLPLFDYVLAADDCCFETNYAKLGQLPEGYAFWLKHQKVSTQVQTRLFLLGERLHASDVVDSPSSFIDKLCKSRSVNDEALAVAKLISSTTADHYRALKKLNQTGNTASLQRLEAEFKIITDQWSSANFQASYKRYVNDVEF